MKILELTELITEFLETLDDEHEDEWFGTDKELKTVGVTSFIEWLGMKEKPCTGCTSLIKGMCVLTIDSNTKRLQSAEEARKVGEPCGPRADKYESMK